MVSLLFCIFAHVIDEDGIDKQHGDCKPRTLRVVPEVNILARRFAALAGLLGTQLLGRALADAAGLLVSHSALDTPLSMQSKMSSFPPCPLRLEASSWSQLLSISLLLFALAVAIRSESESDEVKGASFLRI